MSDRIRASGSARRGTDRVLVFRGRAPAGERRVAVRVRAYGEGRRACGVPGSRAARSITLTPEITEALRELAARPRPRGRLF
jgi:hypothetical protein